MSSQSARRYGAETQALFAEYMRQHGWPYATDAGAGRGGEDVLNVDEAAIEVKGRTGLNLQGWLRQAMRNANGKLPVLVVRGKGQGPASIDQWAFVVTVKHGVALLRVLQALTTLREALDMRDDPESVRQYAADTITELEGQLRLFEEGVSA